MLRAPYHRDHSGIIKKIKYLIAALHAEEQRYNTDAEIINHRQLRDSIRNLAQKNDHYASELQSQLYMIGAEINACAGEEQRQLLFSVPVPGDRPVHYARYDIIQYCCDSEKDIIAVYRNMLNESLPKELRRVLHYQLDGILFGFLQMKLLRHTLNPSGDIADGFD